MKNLRDLSALEKCSLVLVVALLMCLLPLPYGFYIIVRLATAVVAGCWAYKFFQRGQTASGVIACAIALLFQPLFKIVMDRFTWNVVDVLLAVIIVCLVFYKK